MPEARAARRNEGEQRGREVGDGESGDGAGEQHTEWWSWVKAVREIMAPISPKVP